MPTNVYFVGTANPVRLDDGYQKVTSVLQGSDVGHFTRASSGRAVTIYKSSIAYLEDYADSQPTVEFA